MLIRQPLHSRGDAEYREDGIIFSSPFFGVLDGVSALYLPKEGPDLFDGFTGAQVVRNIFRGEFARDSYKELDLASALLSANERVRTRFPENRSDLLSGCTFAFAKINDSTIEIIQGADAMAIWEYKDGRVSWTPNQAYAQELEQEEWMRNAIARHGGDRNKAWAELIDDFASNRRKYVNKKGGYALLNGQPEVQQHWFTAELQREEIKTLLLLTDGYVPFEEIGDEPTFVAKTLDRYREGGLSRILEYARSVERQHKGKTHVDHAEATGIAIDF